MEELSLVAVMLCILAAAGISKRVRNTVVTLPMVYVVLGFLLSSRLLGIVHLGLDNEIVRIIAEATLVLVLAADASRIDLRRVVRDHSLPLRLLAIGLPLTMILGTLTAAVLFDGLPVWEAAILAIILAPTDASLGQPVVSNQKVPARIRQALNIESGLNDGIAMPFLLLAISMAEATEVSSLGSGHWVGLAASQVFFGIAAGAVVGYLGLRFVEVGHKRGWMSSQFEKISALALAFLAYGMAELVGGNGFIAAFCMGLAMGNASRSEMEEELHEHIEVEVALLMLLTFLIYGSVMLPLALETFGIMMLVYAILSLTMVRMVPVAISLIGSKVRPGTTLFLGWFGPRGVASILYIFTMLEAEGLMASETIYGAVIVTVLLSVFVHGVTAGPGAQLYARLMSNEKIVAPDATEHKGVQEMPLRVRHSKAVPRTDA
jgi:NhaP-type Na+/H+ or K+/H+ antiporter